MSLKTDLFGTAPDGAPIHRFTLMNTQGASVSIINYGAAVTSVRMPDRHGYMDEVALGFETLPPYLDNPAYIGTAIGPVSGRIAGASFSLGGREYSLDVNEGLDTNEGASCLHSGKDGYHQLVWTPQPYKGGLRLWLETQGGHGGFPARVTTALDIELSESNQLRYRFRAAANRPTPLSLTRHDYFNLADGGAAPADDHMITIPAETYLALDANNIPTGGTVSTHKTPFDLRRPHGVTSRAFDQHFIIKGRGIRPMARAESPRSGRRLDVSSNADGVQFYNGSFLQRRTGIGGRVHGAQHGFALEPQARPNAVNIANFPSTIVFPGRIYDHSLIYQFGVID